MSDVQLSGETQRSTALSRLDVPQEKPKAPVEEQKPSPFQGPVFFSPRITIDPTTANAVLQVRDTQTGDVLRQYPPDSASQIYQTIQETGASQTIPEAKIVQKSKEAVSGDKAANDAGAGAPGFGDGPEFGGETDKVKPDVKVAVVPEASPKSDASSTAGSLSVKSQASSGLTGQYSNDEKSQIDQSV